MSDQSVSYPDVARLLRHGYGLRLCGEPTLLKGGEDNLNLLVDTDQGTFVLRRYDACNTTRATHELALVNELADEDFPTPKPVQRPRGGWLYIWRKRPVALFPFITGFVPKEYDVPLAEALGSLLAKLHKITEHYKTHLRFENDIAELGRALKRRHLVRLVSMDHWKRTVRNFLERNKATLNRSWRSLPRGVVHHDLHRMNLLVNDNGTPLAVLDFGEACVAPYIVDIVRVWHYIASETEGRRLATPLRDALLKGYQRHRRLSVDELSFLPLYFDLVNLADASRFLASPPDEVTSAEECRSLQIYQANRSNSSERERTYSGATEGPHDPIQPVVA